MSGDRDLAVPFGCVLSFVAGLNLVVHVSTALWVSLALWGIGLTLVCLGEGAQR